MGTTHIHGEFYSNVKRGLNVDIWPRNVCDYFDDSDVTSAFFALL